MSLSGAEMVQGRPLLSRKSTAQLSDCGVVHEVCIDHRGRLPGFSPLTVDAEKVIQHCCLSVCAQVSMQRMVMHRQSQCSLTVHQLYQVSCVIAVVCVSVLVRLF